MNSAANKTARTLDTVAVLALGMLYAEQEPGIKLSSNVFELEGCTVLVAHKRLTVINAIGKRKDVEL